MALPDDHYNALQTVLLQVSEARWRKRWAYYVGDHPKIWATPKLTETFRDLADSMVENYCGLAVNSRLARLEVTGWDGDERAEAIWEAAGLPQRQDVLYRWGLVHGKVFVMVQDDQLAINPATVAYAQPDPDDWTLCAWAGKAWLDFNAGKWQAVLWDETSIYRYDGPTHTPYMPNAQNIDRMPAGQDFVLQSEERHGYEMVPVFACEPWGYQAAPLIDQIAPIQDKINKLSANKFVAAEFGAFKQRIFFTRQQLDPYAVRQQPDHAIVLDPGDAEGKASVQELGGSDLKIYDDAKAAEIDALFTIGMLPRHLRANLGSHVSGEAMRADEAPFTQSLKDNQREFGMALEEAFRLIGVEASPLWRDVEARDEFKQAQTTDLMVQAGVPWQTAVVRFGGMTPEEVAEAEENTPPANPLEAQTQALLSNPFITPQGTPPVQTEE